MALKPNFLVEFHGKQFDHNDIIKAVKDQWVAEGKLLKDLKTLDVYFKPEESACYYVANDEQKGSFNV